MPIEEVTDGDRVTAVWPLRRKGIPTMFGVSLPELVVVFLIALLIFGPQKLPELARTLGKLSADLRRASDAVRREFYNTAYEPIEEKKLLSAMQQELRTLKTELQNPLCPQEAAYRSADHDEEGRAVVPPNQQLREGESVPKNAEQIEDKRMQTAETSSEANRQHNPETEKSKA